MKLKALLTRLVILAVVGGGVAILVWKKPWASAPAKITFQTVQVGKGNIAAQVTATGTLSARGTVQVGAQVSGRVVELNVDFNSPVKKGQVIARLDPDVLQSQIAQAAAAVALGSANVNKAQVAVKDAERQYARQQTLQAQQLIAGATVEAAEVALETARASLLAAKAQAAQASANLAQTRLNLTYATIYSPVDGVVLSRAVELGQTVASSLQAPVLFTIAEDLARMQIDTAVAEADVGLLRETMDATFTVDAFPGKTFKGVVRQVRNAPTTTQGVVTYDAVIDVDNSDKSLRPGMTANVTFVLAQVTDKIKIPNAALRFKPTREQMKAVFAQLGGRPGGGSGSGRERGSGGSGGGGPGGPGGGGPGGPGRNFGDKKPVYKLESGKPRMVLIKPGLTDGSATEMVEGELQPGDELITEITGVKATSMRRTGAF